MAEVQIISVEHLPQAVVVHVLAGELGKKEVDQVCGGIDEARVEAATMPFILDMANVRFVPSLGMGVLVGLDKEFRGRGQRLIFAAMQPDVRRTFVVSHLHRLLEIMDDVPTAIQSVGD